MKVFIVIISAVLCVTGSNIGFSSSYNSVSGSQYHPQSWNNNYDQSFEGASAYGGAPPKYGISHENIYTQHVPVIHNGVPVETPEVKAAKAHFHEEYVKSAALAAEKPDPLNGQYADEYHGSNRWADNERRESHTPQIWESNNGHSNNAYNHQNSLPVETPEVQHAKSAHFQAYAAALGRSGSHNQQHRYRRSISEWAQPKYHGPIHIPHITAAGVPVDTPEVQHARLNHHKLFSEALAHARSSGYVEENSWEDNGVQGHQIHIAPQASYESHYEQSHKWTGPQHIPVLDHNGVPVDTPEVQHAKSAHLQEYATASQRAASQGHHHLYKRSVSDWVQPKYHGPIHIPHITTAGVPVDTPEVQKARSNHHKLFSEALAHAHSSGYVSENNGLQGQQIYTAPQAAYETHYEPNHKWTGPQHIPVLDHNGVPVDTPAVQHAKSAHLQEYATALQRAASHENHHLYKRSVGDWIQPKYHGPIHIPHITAAGVPVDTPEVQHARLNHHKLFNEALANAHSSGYVQENAWEDDGAYGHQIYTAPQAAYENHHEPTHKWTGPQHIPVLDHNGVPIDTPEVQHARTAHLSALAAESLGHNSWEGNHEKW